MDKIDEEAEKYGDLIIATIGEIRRDKAERRKSLNTPIKKLTIYAGSNKSKHILDQAVEDINGTCKTDKIQILPQKQEGRKIQEYPNVQFTVEY